MKKILLLLIIPFLSFGQQETYLIDENFNGFPPDDFSITTDYGDWPGTYSLEEYPYEWRIETSQAVANQPDYISDETPFYIGGNTVLGNIEVYYNPDPITIFTLPAINTTLYNQVVISFDSFAELWSLASPALYIEAYNKIEVSNNQQDWYEVFFQADNNKGWAATHIYGSPVVDITPFQGEEIYIRFICDGKGWWAIDNLQVIGYSDVSGCTDETALNYNPDANIDDGSCITIQEAINNGECPFNLIEDGYDLDDFIGLNYQGGLIFDLDVSTETGLIVTEEVIGSSSFGCADNNTISDWSYLDMMNYESGFSDEIGSGYQNTINGIYWNEQNGCFNDNGVPYSTSLSLAFDLVVDAYDDWYLPSIDELCFTLGKTRSLKRMNDFYTFIINL